MARTDTLGNFLTDVADAIRTKGETTEPIQASDFDTAIANLPSGGGADLSEYFTTEITETKNMNNEVVKKCADITVADNVTSLEYLFSGWNYYFSPPKVICNNNVTSLANMYNNSRIGEVVDLTGLDTSNVITMQDFLPYTNTGYDSDLKTIIFGNNFNTAKVTSMIRMFAGRKGLTSLDLSMFTNNGQVATGNMFYNCVNLTHIDLRGMSLNLNTTVGVAYMFGSSSSNGVPDNCEIIVKDQASKTWVNNKFSRLTNVKTVEEYEAE